MPATVWSLVLSLFMSETLCTQPGGISLHYTYIQHQLIKILTDSFYPPDSRAALLAHKAVLRIWIRSDPDQDSAKIPEPGGQDPE